MKHNKRIALWIAALLCLAMTFSAVFIVLEADHDCHDEHCQICLEIEACVNVLNGLSLALLSLFAVPALQHLLCAAYKQLKKTYLSCTLVSLKVKLTI